MVISCRFPIIIYMVVDVPSAKKNMQPLYKEKQTNGFYKKGSSQE